MFHKQFPVRLNWPVSLIIGLALLALACNSPSFFPEQPTATPTAALSFAVQVQILASPTATPFALSPTPVVSGATPSPLSSPSATPPAPLAQEGQPAVTPVPQAAIPTPLPLNPVNTPAPSPTPAAAAGDGVYTGNITDQIVLLSPDPAYTLPEGADQLEFKWLWLGQELRPCQLPEGYGFEVRLWPSQAEVPAGQRAAVQPLGVIDAVQEQPIIAANCDVKTGTRRYTVNFLRQTPGVRQAGGNGHFFWDVAYIQLKPYFNLMVSAPRDFFIPGSGPEAPPTPALVPTATVAYVLTPGPKPKGTITLLDPAGKPTFPASIGQVEFRWRWEGEGGNCQLPPGYGFEMRIWSAQPGFAPLGVFDAIKSQPQVACDPGSGTYSFMVANLKGVPGVKATYVGDYRWNGQFLWDVVLVSTQPYLPPDSAPSPGSFEISLNQYGGPFDPFGEPLKCSAFPSWIEAQAVFLAADPTKDPHKLDPDGNQIACDELRV